LHLINDGADGSIPGIEGITFKRFVYTSGLGRCRDRARGRSGGGIGRGRASWDGSACSLGDKDRGIDGLGRERACGRAGWAGAAQMVSRWGLRSDSRCRGRRFLRFGVIIDTAFVLEFTVTSHSQQRKKICTESYP